MRGPCMATGSTLWMNDQAFATESPESVEAEPKLQADPSPPEASKWDRWRWENSEDAVRAYALLAGVLVLGKLPVLQNWQYTSLPYFVLLAATTIYIGAHKGLTSSQRQPISMKEGVLAPVVASFGLFGTYLLLKFQPDFNIQSLLDAYFWLLGTFAIFGAAKPVLSSLTASTDAPPPVVLPVAEGLLIDEQGEPLREVRLEVVDFVAGFLALALASAEVLGHHNNFTLNNLVACLVASDILQLLSLKSFRTAALLLCGLLAYDVFWVFGSSHVVGDNVMLTVATSDVLSAPTKLLFPRFAPGVGDAGSYPFSLLGLGDVAVPGLLACLALRYDAFRSTDFKSRAVMAADAFQEALADAAPDATNAEAARAAAGAAELAFDSFADAEDAQRSQAATGIGSSMSSSSSSSEANGKPGPGEEAGMPALVSDAVLQQRTYFTRVMAAYVAGLLVAFGAQAVTNVGQPALLYLVPCTLGAVALTSCSRGTFSQLWAYTDTSADSWQRVMRSKLARRRADGNRP